MSYLFYHNFVHVIGHCATSSIVYNVMLTLNGRMILSAEQELLGMLVKHMMAFYLFDLSGFLFLRLICPALLKPQLFNLTTG